MKRCQMASTHSQIILNEADDNVRADEDSRASDAGAAVHCDWSLVVHGPQVADEANQLLGAVRHAVVGPVCELQVVDVMTLTCLLKQIKLRVSESSSWHLDLFIIHLIIQ